MMRYFIILAIIILFACGGCDDSSDPGVNDYSLTLDVVDTGDDPVEGLQVKFQVHVPEIDDMFGRAKPATAIGFDCPTQCHVTVTIYDLVGEQVRLLLDQPVAAGRHEIVFNGIDDDEVHLIGTLVMRYEMVARDIETKAILHEQSQWMTLYTALDYDQRPILGFTDAAGRVRVDDNLFVPFLHELPELRMTDETGEYRGDFTISDVVTVTLTDTLSGARQHFDFTIKQGSNRQRLVWDPPTMVNAAQGGVTGPVETLIDIADKDPVPDTEWLLYPPCPNPFN